MNVSNCRNPMGTAQQLKLFSQQHIYNNDNFWAFNVEQQAKLLPDPKWSLNEPSFNMERRTDDADIRWDHRRMSKDELQGDYSQSGSTEAKLGACTPERLKRQTSVRFASPSEQQHASNRLDVDYEVADDGQSDTSVASDSDVDTKTDRYNDNKTRDDKTRVLIKGMARAVPQSNEALDYIVTRPAAGHKPHDTILFEGAMDLETEFSSAYERLARQRLDLWRSDQDQVNKQQQQQQQKQQQQQQQQQQQYLQGQQAKSRQLSEQHEQFDSSEFSGNKTRDLQREIDSKKNLSQLEMMNDSITSVYADNTYRLERMPGRRKRNQNRPSTTLKSGYDGFFKPLDAPETSDQRRSHDTVVPSMSPVFQTIDGSRDGIEESMPKSSIATSTQPSAPAETDESGLELTPVKARRPRAHRSRRHHHHHHDQFVDAEDDASRAIDAAKYTCRCCECCWCRRPPSVGAADDGVNANIVKTDAPIDAARDWQVSRQCVGCRQHPPTLEGSTNDANRREVNQRSEPIIDKLIDGKVTTIGSGEQLHQSHTTMTGSSTEEMPLDPEIVPLQEETSTERMKRHRRPRYVQYDDEPAGLPSGAARRPMRSKSVASLVPSTTRRESYPPRSAFDADYAKNVTNNNNGNNDYNKREDKLYKTCQNQHFSIFDNDYPDPLYQVPNHMLARGSLKSSGPVVMSANKHASRVPDYADLGARTVRPVYNNLFRESPDSMFAQMHLRESTKSPLAGISQSARYPAMKMDEKEQFSARYYAAQV